MDFTLDEEQKEIRDWVRTFVRKEIVPLEPEVLRRERAGQPGLTSDERARLKALEREVVELKRANEILKKASAYFAQAELDRRAT